MRRRVLAASAVIVLGLAGGAWAQTVVNVTATVGPACVPISPGSMSFNVFDPTQAISPTAVVQPVIQCTPGAPWNVSYVSLNAPAPYQPCAAGSGAVSWLRGTAPPNDMIPVQFDCGTGVIIGLGVMTENALRNVAVPVNGLILPNDAGGVSPGDYTDTITLQFAQ